MANVNTYLNFQGNTEDAFNFYKSVFGGEFFMVMRFKDTPDGQRVSDADQNKIMHISLPVGNGQVLMGTDVLESAGQHLIMGNNFSIAVGTDSQAEADHIHGGLSAGGVVTMPMQNTFWGSYFGMCTDKFGIQWMISYDANMAASNN